MQLSNSKEGFLKNNMILLLGAQKVGKTVTAATASTFFPEVLPSAVPVELSDILYWQFDKKGGESLAALNLSAPTFKFDELDLVQTTGTESKLNIMPLNLAMEDALAQTVARIKDGVTKTLIIDTISTLNSFWDAFFGQQYPEKTQTGQRYGSLLAKHQTFAQRLQRLPCQVIVLSHTKYRGELMAGGPEQQEAANTKARAMQAQGNARVIPAITGQSAALWENIASVIWPLTQVRDGKGRVTGVFINPYGGGEYENGSRYPGLEMREPAHLRKLFDKIKKGSA